MAKKTNVVNNEATPESQQVIMENQEQKQESRPVTYVVVREGSFRVSDKEYTNPDDPAALAEREFWNRIAVRHSYGERVEIVQYESKKHRIW